MFVLILGSLLIGIVLDELFGLVYRRRRRRTLRDKDQLKRLRERAVTPSTIASMSQPIQ
ncbi:MAG TPA: hypothetical protein VM848_03125 [Acidimicrobiia bacterium]|nr:hypothetical protein [Acidimicrobiia bacterium]